MHIIIEMVEKEKLPNSFQKECWSIQWSFKKWVHLGTKFVIEKFPILLISLSEGLLYLLTACQGTSVYMGTGIGADILKWRMDPAPS